MPEQTNDLEQQVEKIILASFAQPEGEQETNDQNETTEDKRVIDVDLYHLEGGALLLVPNNGTNPLDAHAVESSPLVTKEQDTPVTETPTVPLVENEQHEELPLDTQPEPAPAGKRKRIKPSSILVPLVLLIILAAGAATYLFVLPLEASATITITPQAQSLQKVVAFTIAANPKIGQIQGRPLEAITLTKTKIVPATGHAHDNATNAAGIVTFYNADSQSYSIPAGTSFTIQGVTVVTDENVTVQAVVPPMLGTAYVSAHVVQTGSIGNIAAHAIYTRCCGSQFLTATNTTPFSGGQDAKDYAYIQSSDIQNAASDLLSSLTPQATTVLNKEAHAGEQLVTPLCTPRTQESAEPGSASASVTVSVTQTCSSVAYLTDSLNEVATSTLARNLTLTNYQQEGTTQITVNGSTYTNHTALLKVSLAGIWVYRFTKAQLTQLTHQIAGESQEKARATLEREAGVAQVSIHLQRLDFKDQLPTNTQHISVQFFYLVP